MTQIKERGDKIHKEFTVFKMEHAGIVDKMTN